MNLISELNAIIAESEQGERLVGHAGPQLGRASSATPVTNNDIETIVSLALDYISASHDTTDARFSTIQIVL